MRAIAIGCGESKLDRAWHQKMADLCIAAGAAQERIEHWIQVGRYRAEQAAITPSPGARRRG